MKLWLDDVREAPPGWVHAYSVNSAIDQVEHHWDRGEQLTHVSLDHDLGDFAEDGGDAPKFLDWIVENEVWPTHYIAVHSQNPVGRDNMLRTIDHYGPYVIRYGNSRSTQINQGM